MMQLAYLHGEGILFSFLIHCFFALLGGAALLYGLVKRPSMPGAAVAVGYVIVTSTLTLLSRSFGLDRSCQMTPGVSFICAELNAAVLYFLVAWGLRRG